MNYYNNSLENIQSSLDEQLAKLNELRLNANNIKKPATQQPLQSDRYYLDCGKREDWQEFLKINYGITEEQIFDDYKLFLQAKVEIFEDKNKEKLKVMKERIQSPNARSNNSISNKNTSNANNKQYQQNTNSNENKGGQCAR